MRPSTGGCGGRKAQRGPDAHRVASAPCRGIGRRPRWRSCARARHRSAVPRAGRRCCWSACRTAGTQVRRCSRAHRRVGELRRRLVRRRPTRPRRTPPGCRYRRSSTSGGTVTRIAMPSASASSKSTSHFIRHRSASRSPRSHSALRAAAGRDRRPEAGMMFVPVTERAALPPECAMAIHRSGSRRAMRGVSPGLSPPASPAAARERPAVAGSSEPARRAAVADWSAGASARSRPRALRRNGRPARARPQRGQTGSGPAPQSCCQYCVPHSCSAVVRSGWWHRGGSGPDRSGRAAR